MDCNIIFYPLSPGGFYRVNAEVFIDGELHKTTRSTSMSIVNTYYSIIDSILKDLKEEYEIEPNIILQMPQLLNRDTEDFYNMLEAVMCNRGVRNYKVLFRDEELLFNIRKTDKGESINGQ